MTCCSDVCLPRSCDLRCFAACPIIEGFQKVTHLTAVNFDIYGTSKSHRNKEHDARGRVGTESLCCLSA
jgi:hypothetical protein